MSTGRPIRCRKGDPCRFTVNVQAGIDARYTKARFVVRDAWSETAAQLIAIDETTGITISAGTPGVVEVAIGATLTDAVPELTQPRTVAALLRLYAEADDDDRVSFPIPFELQPDVITDA